MTVQHGHDGGRVRRVLGRHRQTPLGRSERLPHVRLQRGRGQLVRPDRRRQPAVTTDRLRQTGAPRNHHYCRRCRRRSHFANRIKYGITRVREFRL